MRQDRNKMNDTILAIKNIETEEKSSPKDVFQCSAGKEEITDETSQEIDGNIGID